MVCPGGQLGGDERVLVGGGLGDETACHICGVQVGGGEAVGEAVGGDGEGVSGFDVADCSRSFGVVVELREGECGGTQFGFDGVPCVCPVLGEHPCLIVLDTVDHMALT